MANYYLSNNGSERIGPILEEELIMNGMTPNSLVWCKGMEGWTRASDVPQLAKYFASSDVPPLMDLPYSPSPQYPQYPQYPHYSQGQYGQEMGTRPPKPDSNLVWAILTTLFCCLPFGIVAIVKASKVDSLYYSGDYEGAQQASNDAKKWATWSAIASVIFYVLYFFLIIVSGGFSRY